MGWLVEIIEKKIRKQILNNLINILIIDVADEYLIKLQKNKENPSKEIQDYLNKSISLTKKKANIKNISNNLTIMNKEQIQKFNKVINENKEYEELVKKLNFIFVLIKEKELQDKIVNKIYNSYEESKNISKPIKKQKEKMFNFTWMVRLNRNNNKYLLF